MVPCSGSRTMCRVSRTRASFAHESAGANATGSLSCTQRGVLFCSNVLIQRPSVLLNFYVFRSFLCRIYRDLHLGAAYTADLLWQPALWLVLLGRVGGVRRLWWVEVWGVFVCGG